ncbi:MAG: ABC transporter permease [Chloroflexota bacterium]|nr:ABC transporter permease [Chloroflexota bacterium]
MSRYWIGRFGETVPLLIGVSMLCFLIFRLTPGDPVTLVVDPSLLSPEERAAVRHDLGLDDPLPMQYVKMMRGLARGDLRSFKSKQPTYQIVRDAFPTTLVVTTTGLGLAVLIANPFGAFAARRPGGWVDRALSASMATTLAFPPFLFGILLLRILTEAWHVLPGSGLGPPGTVGFQGAASLPYLVMPTLVVALGPATILARYLRDGLTTTLAEDYIRTARAKGFGETYVVTRHALRNASLVVVSLLNTIVPVTLGGSAIVETVFGLPGLGKVTTTAALSRDYPVVLTNVFFIAVVTLAVSLVVDLVYGVLDPRIRLQQAQ